MTPASVSREVNYLYFFIVLGITSTVIGIALYTRNKRAVRIFLFAMVVWAVIESIGIVTGMRVYDPFEDRMVIFIFVAFVEDPGWVCLGYMMAEQFYKRLKLIKLSR
jgi:predicted membrane channel-forming protein YqfA (hemolysin III family)